ncbi:class I adenylate-forming enzyme family protein [Streptomyces poriferorum]|uniref:class I adenylate-forming enzyme family protein n=1 Tax=Streptomyces poriferorum TaxID=2798799 RepID=UPI00273E1AE0|nr:class I adenylate-forming enzyme family protein [Streptomyces sp. Alt1]WLQ48922.1 class I adenylate-forming enzyme family protein [Streptomyces sp. Alt1]
MRPERPFVPHPGRTPVTPPSPASPPSPAESESVAESVAAATAAARVHAALAGPGGPFAVVRAEDGPQAGSLMYADGPRTLREFVETTWAFGDRPFLMSGVAGERGYAYGEFFAAASALACRLSDTYGLQPGDRAVVAMRNRPEWQIAFWAAQLAGLVAVPLDPRWTEAEFTFALDDSGPRVLLVDGERLPPVADWARKAGARVVVFHAEDHRRAPEDHVERYEDLPAPDPLAAPPEVEARPEDDATILYAPRATGRSQGIVATQLAQAGAARNPRFHAATSALGRGAVPGQESAPVTLLTFPFFHVAALSSLYAAMSAGGSVVLMGDWDAEEALRLIREHRVTNYAGTPETALDLLAEADRTGDRPESLRMLDTGGSAPPHDLVARLAARGERIEPYNGYGPAETGGAVMANSGAEYRLHPGSAGRPTPSTEVRIAGPAGEALPEGETGELWLRGQALARGYWRDEEATAKAFTGGWFRTGDLAVIHDGRADIVGRKAESAEKTEKAESAET